MKLVIDDKIPYIRAAAEKIADEVVYLKGSEINRHDILEADALIIRTRTKCDESLLKGSKVRFIATATIGYDHIDTKYLNKAGIKWSNCPGCNATSVGQYLRSCLLLLKKEKGYSLNQLTVGIIGAGHVGMAVKSALEPMGMHILLNDPPKVESAIQNTSEIGSDTYVTLEEIKKCCDVITFHTPLTHDGPYPTYHLADRQFFLGLKKQPVIINTSRGEVIDNSALLEAINNNLVRETIIDTWENEPDISRELLNKVYIGTPHIAGYSADGKANASRMAINAVCRFFGLTCNIDIVPPQLFPPFSQESAPDSEEVALMLYNPHSDSKRLKLHPEDFENLRGNYPLRREQYDI